jgi:hypothetical protein
MYNLVIEEHILDIQQKDFPFVLEYSVRGTLDQSVPP